MDGVGTTRFRSRDEAIDAKVAFGRRRAAQGDGVIGHAHVQRVAIGIGEHGHRANPTVPAGPDDAACDLTAVRYEESVQLAFGAIQPGLRLSRNALSPSWPSADTRRSAIADAVMSASAA